jgi:hypothetical protein
MSDEEEEYKEIDTEILEQDDETEESNNKEEQESEFEIKDSPDKSDNFLKLGDIIEILAPTNSDIHESTFFIEYIDDSYISLVNVATLKHHPLNISDSGVFTDESITNIILHSRNKVEGYARQNNLLPRTWVDIHFGGEIPVIITGEITELLEDQIEIRTYPELKVIYIDFGYKGIPKDLPLEKIVIREKPSTLNKIGSLKEIQGLNQDEIENLESTEEDVHIQEFDDGTSIIHLGDSEEPVSNFHETMRELYQQNKGIIIGDYLQEIAQTVEIPEHQKRYGLDTQINSIIDEMLSGIPNSQRTKRVMDRIHRLVERYRELRAMFSKFDENDNIRALKTKDAMYKPLVEKIMALDTKLKWLLPVVATKKKIYKEENDVLPEESDIIISEKSTVVIQNEIDMQDTIYYKNKSNTGTSRYYTMYETLSDLMKPFVEYSQSNEFLKNDRVKTDLEAIVDNMEDHYSSVLHNMNIVKRRYVIETYNLGLSKLETSFMNDNTAETANSMWRRCTEGGKRNTTRIEMSPADKMALKSIILLPKSVMQYSKLYLPATKLLDRSNLHQTDLLLFRLLRKDVDIIPHIVDDLTKEIDHEAIEKETEIGFLSKITEYVLADENQNEPNKFERFLNTVFPKTKVLLRLIQKYIRNKLSFVDVVDAVEPFMIYTSDISFKQYSDVIRYFIKTRITEIKKELQEKYTAFQRSKNTKYEVVPEMLPVLRLLMEKKEIMDLFLNSYQFKDKDDLQKSLSSYEIIQKIISIDNGVLFSTLLSSLMMALRTPNNLAVLMDDDMGRNEKIKATDCSQKRLTKKYDSIEALQKENYKDEVYWDKEYDNTPYDIMQKYKDDQKKMLSDKFVKYLEENLIQKHDCPREKAPELAQTLILGKRMVTEGDYALVEITPKLPKHLDESELSEKEKEKVEVEKDARKKTLYFHRRKNTWVQDKDIDEEYFIDSDLLFCNLSNLSNKCVKTSAEGDCESEKEAKARIIAEARKRAKKEFDRRYEVSSEDLKTSLEKEITKQLKFMARWNVMRYVQQNKSNLLEYDIGSTVQMEEIIQSPYLKLRDMILSQSNFVKKQGDIVKFAALYTRDPFFSEDSNEEQHWKYCKETNTKLLPDFFLILAQEFVLGSAGDYGEKLLEVRASHGKLSDDGDSIVDEYSGYVICKRDFSNEEGYTEEGFKIKTNAVLELTNMEVDNESERIFENETSQIIYNVFSTVCKNIDVPMEEIESSVLRISMELVQNPAIISTEKSHKKHLEKTEREKGKKLPPYNVYRNEMIITITASVLLACIQGIIELKTKKTFPGCVRSFSGFPFGGIDDMSSIEYMACVLEKMKNPTTEPWNAINKLNRTLIKDRITNITKSAIVNHADIERMFVEKRQYMILHPELDTIPKQHSIKKWTQFLPPILVLDIVKHLQPLNAQFKNDFMELMKRGDKAQREDLNVFKSKVMQYSYGLLQKIQEMVSMKTVLLKTMTNVPFLQNACCNENERTNPIQYFAKEDPTINEYIRVIESLASNLYYVNQISKAGLLFDPKRTNVRMNFVPNGIFDENIYGAFVYYTGLDRSDFIYPEFRHFISEVPQEYNRKSSIQEKMALLKRDGKQFSIHQLEQLMSVVHKRNIVTLFKPQKYSFVEVLPNIIQNFENTKSILVEKGIRDLLRDCLTKYQNNPNVMLALESEESEDINKELEELQNYLYEANETMYSEIMNFINEYGNLSRLKLEKINDFLSTNMLKCKEINRKYSIHSWELDCEMEKTGAYYDNGLYTVYNFIKHAVYDMTHVFPEIILKDVNYSNIPNHWNLGKNDNSFIFNSVKNYMSSLNAFKQDNVISLLLEEVKLKNVDLFLFISNLPIHTPIHKKGTTFYSIFDKKTVYMLLMYVFYSVLYEYIDLTNDSKMLKLDVYKIRQERRDEINEKRNPSNKVFSEPETLGEEVRDVYEEMDEMHINVGKKEDLKSRIAKLLITYLEIIQKNKAMVDFSYEKISEKVRDSKIKEKNLIISKLERLTIEERRVENMMKGYKLGKWNVGEQKGLFIYDEATQDRERQEMMEQGVTDIEIQYYLESEYFDQTHEALDADQMNELEQQEGVIRTENEGLDFEYLREDYANGYGEDDEAGDFPDD